MASRQRYRIVEKLDIGGMAEIYLAKTQAKAGFKNFEMFITVAIIYWILSIVFELLQARIEAHYGKGVRAR